MEMENPSFLFVIGAVILTPRGPNDYNCLDKSYYTLHPNVAYHNHSQIDSALVYGKATASFHRFLTTDRCSDIWASPREDATVLSRIP